MNAAAAMRHCRTLNILLALSLSASAVQGQDAPVPKIPETLPLAARNRLTVVRAPLLDRVGAHNRKVEDFNSRCGRIPAVNTALAAACGKEYQIMTGEEKALVEDKRRFAAQLDSSVAADAGCATLATQLESDKEAIRRQQRTSEMGVAEIDAWRKANEEALKEAALDGAKYFLSRTATALEKRESSARTYEGWMTRYAKQMKDKHVPFEVLQEKIESAVHGYVNAKLDVAAGTVLTRGLDADEIFENFRTQAGLVARDAAEADAAMKAALSDPTFQKFVRSDATGWDLLRSTLDVASSATGLERISPQYALASLVVDGSYDATKWTLSRDRIMQQYNMSDTVLKAVASLQRQIEKKWLKVCRWMCSAARSEPPLRQQTQSGDYGALRLQCVPALMSISIAIRNL